MGFFNLRSTSTQFLIIFVPLAAMVGGIEYATAYAPGYVTDMGYAALFVIFLPIGYLVATANIQGPKYPHIELSIFDPMTKVAYSIVDFFVEIEPEQGAPVMDVFALGLYCDRCKKPFERGIATGELLSNVSGIKVYKQKCPECESCLSYKDRPQYVFGRWWYPYLALAHLPVGFGDYDGISGCIFILPHPWRKFLGFGRREDGAVYLGEVISPGTSTHLDAILAPFTVDFVGTTVPVLLGVLSTYTIEKITEDWEHGMKELSRILSDMDKFVQEQSEHIYPKAQVEDLMQDVFPEIKVHGTSRRTRAPIKPKEEIKDEPAR